MLKAESLPGFVFIQPCRQGSGLSRLSYPPTRRDNVATDLPQAYPDRLQMASEFPTENLTEVTRMPARVQAQCTRDLYQ